MSKAKTIYLVSVGCYSDYCIMGAFSTKAKAAAYRDILIQHGKDVNGIEEYDLDAAHVQSMYVVEIDLNGVEKNRWAYLDYKGVEPGSLHTKADSIICDSSRGFDVALKAARDKLAEIKYQEAETEA